MVDAATPREHNGIEAAKRRTRRQGLAGQVAGRSAPLFRAWTTLASGLVGGTAKEGPVVEEGAEV